MPKTVRFSATLVVFCILMALIGNVNTFAATSSFVLSSAQTNTKAGDIVEVTVIGNRITGLFAYELLLTYDSRVLELSGSPRSELDGKLIVHENEAKDALQVGFTRLDGTMISEESLALCTVRFRVKTSGASAVRLDWVKQYDNKLVLRQETLMQRVTFAPFPVVVEVTPIPSGNLATVDLSDNTIPLGFLENDALMIKVPAIKGTRIYAIDLPDDIFSPKNSGKILTIETEFATLYLPLDILTDIDTSKGPNRLTMTDVDPADLPGPLHATVENRPVVGIALTAAGKDISRINPAERMRLSIPYAIPMSEQQSEELLAIRQVTDGGKSASVTTGRYRAEARAMVLDTGYFGVFAVMKASPSFGDLGSFSWAKQAIESLAAKGIASGTGTNRFSPQSNVTRADFVTLLVRTLDLHAVVSGNFEDVPKNAYYYNPVGIAKALGIASGTGGNRFSPSAGISREDMICMAEKALRIKGHILGSADLSVLEAFSDSRLVSVYAKSSMAALIGNGIIQGNENRLSPKGSTTRAAAAVMLHQMYEME